MIRKHDPSQDDDLGSDLDAFEEFETGSATAPTGEIDAELTGAEAEEFDGPEAGPTAGLDLDDLGGDEPELGPVPAPAPSRPARPRGTPVEERAAPAEPEGFTAELAKLAPDMPVNLVAVIGKTTTSVAELLRFKMGHVIDLARPPSETVDIVANGKLIARGELVEMDGKLGARILKLVR